MTTTTSMDTDTRALIDRLLAEGQAKLVYPGSTILGFTEDGEAIPAPIVIKRSALPDKGFMSHAVVAAGYFESVAQARKAGFIQPISLGVHKMPKRRRPIEIVEG